MVQAICLLSTRKVTSYSSRESPEIYRLPWQRHLARDITRTHLGSIEAERFDERKDIAEFPTRFDSWKESSTHARLQGCSSQPLGGDSVFG